MLLLVALAFLLVGSVAMLLAGAVLCAVLPTFRRAVFGDQLPLTEQWPRDYPKRRQLNLETVLASPTEVAR